MNHLSQPSGVLHPALWYTLHKVKCKWALFACQYKVLVHIDVFKAFVCYSREVLLPPWLQQVVLLLFKYIDCIEQQYKMTQSACNLCVLFQIVFVWLTPRQLVFSPDHNEHNKHKHVLLKISETPIILQLYCIYNNIFFFSKSWLQVTGEGNQAYHTPVFTYNQAVLYTWQKAKF